MNPIKRTTKRNATKRNRKVIKTTENTNFQLARTNQTGPMTAISAESQQAAEVPQHIQRELIQRRQQEATCFLITKATERHLSPLAVQERGLALGIDNKLVQLIQHDESISFLRDSLTHAAFARVVTAALRCTAAGIEAAHFASQRLAA